MRIAINGIHLSFRNDYTRAGVSNYTLNLITSLPRLKPGHQFLVLVDKESYPQCLQRDLQKENLRIVRCNVQAGQKIRRILWEQLALPFWLQRNEIDLFHGLVNILPISAPCRTVATIHDLVFFSAPATLYSRRNWYNRLFIRFSFRKASRILTDSNHTLRCIRRFLDKEKQKPVDVVPLGCDHTRFRVIQQMQELEEKRERLGLPPEFILNLNTLEPRKNILGLLAAYARYRRVHPAPLPLVIAGSPGWLFEKAVEVASRKELCRHVRLLGFVEDEDLPALYNLATFLICPSLLEGFGLPVLEAMACGTPVAVSNNSSLIEVTGEHCLSFDPTSEKEICEVLVRLTDERDLRCEIAFGGVEKAQTFSWERTAALTLESYTREGPSEWASTARRG